MTGIVGNPLSRVIDEITSVSNLGQFSYGGKIHVRYPDKPEKEINIDKILNIDVIRDPQFSYADQNTITMLLNRADYAMYVQPNPDILSLSLTATPLLEDGSGADIYRPNLVQQFKAVLLDRGNPIIEGNGSVIPSREMLEQQGPITVSFQLIDLAVVEFLHVKVGTTIVDTTVENALKGVLGKYCNDIKLDAKDAPKGVKMVVADNIERRNHIVIEHVVPLTDIPGYLQHKEVVYTTVLGYYYSKQFWHIWPLLNLNRYNQSNEKAHIINVPTNRLTGVERTWRQKDGTLTILSTGNVKFVDPSEAFQLNVGNATVFGNSNNMVGNAAKVEGNKMYMNSKENVNIFANNERRDKKTNVGMSANRLSDNVFVEASKMAIRDGVIVQAVWKNANLSGLQPYHPVRFSYYDGDLIRDLYGVVLKVQVNIALNGTGITTKAHNTSVAVTLFLERPEKDQGV